MRAETGIPCDGATCRIVLSGHELNVDGQDLERIDDREQGREGAGEENELASHFRRPLSVGDRITSSRLAPQGG
jgi:hypothetical protein